ncbi:MAG: SDR family oxidoreductase, partial [Armatimonadetes bacterium]|nr:SDR family oxidoreductase [Armatimonadota bacterium]
MGCLDGQVALVTGAGRGIGRACAELLAAEGAAVVLVARTAEEVSAAAAQIRAAGGEAEAVPGDITDDGFVKRLFEGVQARHGRLDILVNNAGIAPGGGVAEQSVEALRQCLELNVVALYACLQQAVLLMRANGDTGKIINIGSVRTHWTEAGGGGTYNASKYALKAI